MTSVPCTTVALLCEGKEAETWLWPAGLTQVVTDSQVKLRRYVDGFDVGCEERATENFQGGAWTPQRMELLLLMWRVLWEAQV